MILGYEAPVDIPVLSIYDKGMMQMYIQALLKDYERGLEEQKEFMSAFGNYTSPSEGDVEAWNDATINRVLAFLQNNPDAMRSVEGRAALSRLMSSIPYADLAKLRQAAETKKQYMNAMQQLAANGKYDRALEEARGVADIRKHNTLRDGMWTEVAPMSTKSLYELTHDRFDPLAKANFVIGLGKNKYYTRKGVTEKHMRPIADTALDGIKNTPYYDYYLKVYGSDEGIKQAMINANKAVLHEDEVADNVALTMYEQEQQNYRARLSASGKQTKDDGVYSLTSDIYNGKIGNYGYNSEKDYEAAVEKVKSSLIASYKKNNKKDPTKSQIAAYDREARRSILSLQIKAYMDAGMSTRRAVLATGTNSYDSASLNRELWGADMFDEETGWTKNIDASIKNKMYRESDVIQMHKRSKSGRGVPRYGQTNTTKNAAKGLKKIRVSAVDNVYTVYDPEQGRDRIFVKCEGAMSSNKWYYDATDDLSVNKGKAAHVDQTYNESVGLKSKSTESVLGTNR